MNFPTNRIADWQFILKLKKHEIPPISGRSDNCRVTWFHNLRIGNPAKWGWRFRKLRFIFILVISLVSNRQKVQWTRGPWRKIYDCSLTRAVHSRCTGHLGNPIPEVQGVVDLWFSKVICADKTDRCCPSGIQLLWTSIYATYVRNRITFRLVFRSTPWRQ